jgi:hypothetical protein
LEASAEFLFRKISHKNSSIDTVSVEFIRARDRTSLKTQVRWAAIFFDVFENNGWITGETSGAEWTAMTTTARSANGYGWDPSSPSATRNAEHVCYGVTDVDSTQMEFMLLKKTHCIQKRTLVAGKELADRHPVKGVR